MFILILSVILWIIVILLLIAKTDGARSKKFKELEKRWQSFKINTGA